MSAKIDAADESGQQAPDTDAAPASNPDKGLISRAAKSLGQMPKHLVKGRRRLRRKWTGFVNGTRVWAGREIILPDACDGRILRIQRGVALVETVDPDDPGVMVRLRVPADELQLFRLPAAVLVGRLKGGKKEIKSLKKLESCRRNAKRPARPGHRRRGRPSSSKPLWNQFALQSRRKPLRGLSVDSLLKRVVEEQAELKECIRLDAEKRAKRMARAIAGGGG